MKDLQKIAVVIDADHIQACGISDVLHEISTYGRIAVKRAYGNFRKGSLSNWEDELRRLAIKAEQQFDERSANMALVIDTMELLHSRVYDAFAIVSGNNDYTPLAVKLCESGVYVIGAGDQKTPESFRGVCDEFLCLENLSVDTDNGSAPPEEDTAADDTDAPPEEDTAAEDAGALPEEDAAAEDTDIPSEEEAVTDDSGTPPKESNTAIDRMDRIHHLIRFAWRSCRRRKDGYINTDAANKFIKPVYGRFNLFELLLAYPARYEVIRKDDGSVLYRCAVPEEEEEREEALTQEDIQAQEKDETGGTLKDTIDYIHHLLRRACDAYRREDGYVTLAHAVYFFKYTKPSFNPGDYGFETLSQLIQAYPDQYEVARDSRGRLIYKQISSIKTGKPQDGTGAADDMDRIHHLLRFAWRSFKKEGGYAAVDRADHFIQDVKPGFRPSDYGFETLSQLILAYPGRYEVSRDNAGNIIYKCTITVEKDERAEALTQEDIQARVKPQGTAGTKRVHYLLRRACGAYRRQDGYVTLAHTVYFFKYTMPYFDPGYYGFESLSQLIQAFPDRYKVARDDRGGLLYRLVRNENADKPEMPRGGTGAVDSIDSIHELLRRACGAYRREDGYVTLAHAIYFFRHSKPDFNPGNYGFETLSQLIQAYPARYEVIEGDAGDLIYRCISFVEAAKAEEAESGDTDSIDHIHSLLRRACDIYRWADGFAKIDDADHFIHMVKPEFGPETYGFGELSRLVRAFSDRYEVKENDRWYIYRCMPSGETEEPRGGTAAADGMDRIHYLLRRACDTCRQANGYILISDAGNFIRKAIPTFSPYNYGFQALTHLIGAYPDRYQVRKGIMNSRNLSYKCLPPDAAAQAEELDRIHHLLRRTCDVFRQADGYAKIADAGYLIKQIKPYFDLSDYGFETLSQLIQAFPDWYEVTQNAMGILIYKCITPVKENKEEDVQLREETGSGGTAE